ncbi:ABC transporter ATP-binding protein [Streptomyces sp. NPDC005574]|uniref:ABC transporter ATP-binding protein n=1 Tax=Streptomyces sp. NPDC005574 TaxID=3156891 RepID=UPI0033B5BB9E
MATEAAGIDPSSQSGPAGPAPRRPARPGTIRRILPYAARHRRRLALLLTLSAVDAVAVSASPLILKLVVDDGIVPGRVGLTVALCLATVGLAAVDALAEYLQARLSGKIGEGLIYDLRTSVFDHVQRQPLAFFARTQTGSLVSRLNTDVIGAQQAVTSLLSQSVGTLLTMVFVLVSMFWLSWPIALAALLMIPCVLVPARFAGRRLQRLTRVLMQHNADLGSTLNERFNVSGALLTKLYGRPEAESAAFAERAGVIRDVAVRARALSRLLSVTGSLLTSLTIALVFGLGGVLVIHGSLRIGTLVAMVTLLMALYGPLNQLTNMQSMALTALVSFERVFEVLDLEPAIADRPGATALGIVATAGNPGNAGSAGAAPEIEFDRVSFRYPSSAETSLMSLEGVAGRGAEREPAGPVLTELSFIAPAGRLTALVGPSGGGKTTITQLVPRLYEATSGAVLVGGRDVRDLTSSSLHAAVGVVTQDAHLFHDTIRANLAYACPKASEGDIIEACETAHIWDLVRSLPDGLDTVVGDQGHRLSGGERQRISLVRLLLKSPPVVVLDEATAHLDSESEAAIQKALKTALAGRTSLVIAHRLSTVRDADQILVVDRGRIRERGTHEQLLAADDLYAELHRAQFDRRPAVQ